MPKTKTHKGIAKRFRATATGKVKHRRSGTSHLAWRLSAKQVRKRRGTTTAAPADEKRIIKALAQGGF